MTAAMSSILMFEPEQHCACAYAHARVKIRQPNAPCILCIFLNLPEVKCRFHLNFTRIRINPVKQVVFAAIILVFRGKIKFNWLEIAPTRFRLLAQKSRTACNLKKKIIQRELQRRSWHLCFLRVTFVSPLSYDPRTFSQKIQTRWILYDLFTIVHLTVE
jgi:hypothetical protein